MSDQFAQRYIVSQTRSNIDFLVSQNLISRADGEEILAKLPPAEDSSSCSIGTLVRQTQLITLEHSESITPSPNPVVPRGIVTPQRTIQVRALWNWNNDGQNPNDLPFRAGDVFEIVSETNADWWTGRNNGKQGLFPSNYVEKINHPSSSPSTENPQSLQQDRNFPAPPYAPQYKPPMSPPAAYQPPPIPNQHVAYNPYMGPPGNIATAQPIPDQPQPPKKSRFGGMGNTLAQSAVGGVGFGAGSAVGSGIINSIF